MRGTGALGIYSGWPVLSPENDRCPENNTDFHSRTKAKYTELRILTDTIDTSKAARALQKRRNYPEGVRYTVSKMGEDRFEFHQLPRDVEGEVKTQAREILELFEKWCMCEKTSDMTIVKNKYIKQGTEGQNEVCDVSL